ncbi:phosphoribosylamine--glycine ligase [Carboxydothermus pertinax]|uniref:Phosphoribosylamine--glycine ligase n=1 Tax=Carboxydothermus pertinax TaxID=870242 RepID=A0A1L8CYJ1_9THEO|nr:phosphoribosylamine--glycine ligase [Carboxydothermus pertinax]GAV23941.1 phosphoribosylamine--glycine ligase [Carboxydothermus pertinax]
MKVLVVGSGGREHAIVKKLKESPKVTELLAAPGNAGIAQEARVVPVEVDNLAGLLEIALREKVDLTVVGPELPLTLGIVDYFNEHGLLVFGPNRDAAQIEGSKSFAKEIMKENNIPTAFSETFDNFAAAREYVYQKGVPIVIKADGLAAGKGVYVCQELEEALKALEDIFIKRIFGAAGNRVVIEEYLEGQEVSVLAFTDGETVVPMVPAQDHKRVFNNDQGPNTGGMGAYAPAPIYTPAIAERVQQEILLPTIRGLRSKGITYRGVLYAGLILTREGPKVLEFNARFGDPETQVILPLLKTDLVEIMLAVVEKRLFEVKIEFLPKACATVVLASGGYPGKYETGKVIHGLDRLPPGVVAYHAGTAFNGDDIVTAGGRVLNITAVGDTLKAALALAYEGVKAVSFEGMHYRTDIGQKALKLQ